MQSINDAAITEDDFLTADQMREITATPEELFDKQVESIKENFMTSMVRTAREQGRQFYAGTFIKQGNEKLIKTIASDFQEMGYVTESADTVQNNGQQEIPVTVLTISWKKN